MAKEEQPPKDERVAGFDGPKSERVSFRAPPELVRAAKRQTGIESTADLCRFALSLLAQPDPFVAAMRRIHGRLGPDHELEY